MMCGIFYHELSNKGGSTLNFIEIIGENKSSIIAKSGNTHQKHMFKLFNKNKDEINLSGKSVYVYIADKDRLVLMKEMEIEDSDSGIVSFHFYEEENLSHGRYDLEIHLKHDNIHYEIFPYDKYISLHIIEDLSNKNLTEYDKYAIHTLSASIIESVKDAKEQGDFAKEQGDFAKEQGDFAKEQGDYAKEQGDYAKEQGDYAKEFVESEVVISVNGKNGVVEGLVEQDELESLDKRVEEAENKVISTEQDIISIQQEVGNVQQETENIQQEIESVRDIFSQNTIDVNERFNSIDGIIEELEDRIKELENNKE